MPVEPAQLDWFSRLLTIDPSWSMVSVVLILALIYLLSKNTAFTKSILESVSIVKQIRADQVLSNEERVKQTTEISGIKADVHNLSTRMEKIEKAYPVCINHACVNRESNEN